MSAEDVRPRLQTSARDGSIVLLILVPLFLLELFDRTLISVMLPAIGKEFALSDSSLGALGGTAFAIGLSVAIVPSGILADRFDRRWVIAGGVALWSAMTVASGLSRTYSELFVSRIGLGIGEAALSPAAYAIISDLISAPRRPLAMACVNAGANVGTGLALAVGGVFVAGTLLPEAMSGWRAGFIFTGVVGLAASVLPLLLPRAAASPRRPKIGGDRNGLSLPAFLKVGAAFLVPFDLGIVCGSLFGNGVATWQPAFYVRTFGLGIQSVGATLGAIGLVTGIGGTLAAGWLAMRINLARGRDSSVDLLFWSALTMVPLTALAFSPVVLWLNLGATTLGTLIAAMLNPLALVAIMGVVPSHLRGRVLAVVSFVVSISGYTFGPYIYGATADALGLGDSGFWITMAALSTALTLGCALLIGLSRPAFRRLSGTADAPPEMPATIPEAA